MEKGKKLVWKAPKGRNVIACGIATGNESEYLSSPERAT
jgi:hypothetical protein